MVGVAQLVRAPDCGSGGRGFDPRRSPLTQDSGPPRANRGGPLLPSPRMLPAATEVGARRPPREGWRTDSVMFISVSPSRGQMAESAAGRGRSRVDEGREG